MYYIKFKDTIIDILFLVDLVCSSAWCVCFKIACSNNVEGSYMVNWFTITDSVVFCDLKL